MDLRRHRCLLLGVIIMACLALPAVAQGPRRQLSEDRDLKEIDLTAWDCRNRPEGSARTPDGQERNRLKNRFANEVVTLSAPDLDVAGFVRSVSQFDAMTVRTRRKDLSAAAREQLDPMEKEIVQVTGYLGVAYCGPPETTNCASVDFHDWHLELFEKTPQHPPQIGDSTPIVCEITPRTQTGIYADKIRIQKLTAFFRRSDLEYEATGHAARKIRVIGYRLWDDEHNGAADVGTTVRRITPNKYHNPWRQTAWEIHPVIKIVPADGAAPNSATSPPAASTPPSPTIPGPAATITPAPTAIVTATPIVNTPSVQPQSVTITKAVTIRIPYGQTTLARGTKLPFVSRDAQSVTVRYAGEKYTIPISSTDLQ